MANDDLITSIRVVVKEELGPIKKTLEGHTAILEEHTKKLDGITDQLVDVSEDVNEIKEASKSNDERISAIEDNLDLPIPIR